MEARDNPVCILLFSGKRKSGKDYFTGKLLEAWGADDLVIIRISAPIKSHFAKSRNLDLEQLMGDGEYKERFRKEMIDWSEEMRQKDPGVFCRSAIEMHHGYLKKYWIVSDVRRKSDVKWFKENFGDLVKTARIEADIEVRRGRGWSFTPGVDDISSECDLDDYKDWDWVFENNGSDEKLNECLKIILEYFEKLR